MLHCDCHFSSLFVSALWMATLREIITLYAQQDEQDEQFIDDIEKILRANDVTTIKLLGKTDAAGLLHVVNGPKVTAGKRSFIVGMVEHLREPEQRSQKSTSENVKELLTRVLDKPAKATLAEVNMDAQMLKCGLRDLFPLEAWPAITPVRQLATWQAAKVKHVGSKLFSLTSKSICPHSALSVLS